MSEKSKITLRIDTESYEYLKNMSGYQNIINHLVKRYVLFETSNDAYHRFYDFPELLNVINTCQILTFPTDIKVFHKKLKEFNDILNAKYPHRYYYIQAKEDMRLSAHDFLTDILIDGIKDLERLYPDDFIFNGQTYSLSKLNSEQYDTAAFRLALLDHVLPYDTAHIKERIKLLDIDFDFLTDYIFKVALEDDTKFVELKDKISLVNIGFETYQATLCFSYLVHNYYVKKIGFLDIIDNKIDGIDISVGISELIDGNLISVLKVGNRTNIRLNEEAINKCWSTSDGEYVDLITKIKLDLKV